MPRTVNSEAAASTPEDSSPVAVAESPSVLPAGSRSSSRQLRGGWAAAEDMANAGRPTEFKIPLGGNHTVVKFLEDTPFVTLGRHWVERVNDEGKKYKAPITCLGSLSEDCPLCDIGAEVAVSSAFNVALLTPEGSNVASASLRYMHFTPAQTKRLKKLGTETANGLTDGFWAFHKTTKSNGFNEVEINWVKNAQRVVEDDYKIAAVPDESVFQKMVPWTDSIITVPTHEEVAEIAAEISVG